MSKTMKKVLSLALALVMVLGMVAPIAAFAEDAGTQTPGAPVQNTPATVFVPAPEGCPKLPDLVTTVQDKNGNVYNDPYTIKAHFVPGVTYTLDNAPVQWWNTDAVTITDNARIVINPEMVQEAIDKAEAAQKLAVDVKLELAFRNGWTVKELAKNNPSLVIDEVNNKAYINFRFIKLADGCWALSSEQGNTAERVIKVGLINPTCFHVKAAGPNYEGIEGVQFEVYKIKKTVDANGDVQYQYNVDTKEPVVDGNKIFTTDPTNRDGYTSLLPKVDVVKFISDNGIKAGELLAVKAVDSTVTSNVKNNRLYVVNIWNEKEVKRYDAANKIPLVEPERIYELTCKSKENVAVIPFANLMAKLRVKVAVNGSTPELRYPIEGAKLALYEGRFNNLGQVVTTENLKLVQEVKTDKEGFAVFNVPFNPTVPVFADGTGQVTFITVPYVLRQLDAGSMEGAKIVDYPIVAGGTYYPTKAYPVGPLFSYDAQHPNAIDVEIFNDVDNFGPSGRIAGSNRYETAVKIADRTFPGGPASKTVVVASGHKFPDALTGGVLAHLYNAPMLLVGQNEVPEVVAKYIEKNKINQVIILGRTDTISNAVENELFKLAGKTARVGGTDRFETAKLVGDQVIKELNDSNIDKFLHGYYRQDGKIFLANGRNFADSLVASVPAMDFGTPILLTEKDKLPQVTVDAIKAWNVKEVIIVGGVDSVSDNVKNELSNAGLNVKIQRYHGINRQTTAMEIAKALYPQTTHAFFASGEQFADALTGALLAAKHNSPILLVGKDSIDPAVKKYIQENGVTTGTILGGTDSVSAAVRDELAGIMTLRILDETK